MPENQPEICKEICKSQETKQGFKCCGRTEAGGIQVGHAGKLKPKEPRNTSVSDGY